MPCSTQTSETGTVFSGHLTNSLAADTPFTRSAFLARGTLAKRDSLIRLPSSVFLLRSLFVRDPFCTSRPVIVSAAYDEPPRAMKTAVVATTFA